MELRNHLNLEKKGGWDKQGCTCISSQIKFKTAMLKWRLCDYNDAYILVKGTVIVFGEGASGAAIAVDRNDKEVIFKNFTLFTNCISQLNITKIFNTKDLDVVKLMFNMIVYINNYSKKQ